MLKFIYVFCVFFFVLPRAEIAKNVPNATTTKTTINFERKLRQVELKVKPTNEDGVGKEQGNIRAYICFTVYVTYGLSHTHTHAYTDSHVDIEQTELWRNFTQQQKV